MTRQVADIKENGTHIKVIFCDRGNNPYRIYIIKPVFTDHGVTYSRKLIECFADFNSCLYWIAEAVRFQGDRK